MIDNDYASGIIFLVSWSSRRTFRSEFQSKLAWAAHRTSSRIHIDARLVPSRALSHSHPHSCTQRLTKLQSRAVTPHLKPFSFLQDMATMAAQQDRPRLPKIRFRVLIIGRANAGKTSILKRVCETTDNPEIYRLDPSGNRQRVVRSRSQKHFRSYHLPRFK